MSQAEELLNSMSTDELTQYSVSNEVTDHIVIGKDRYICIPDSMRKLGVQYDHNIETVTFDCPRYWDDHDLSSMTIYINYRLSNGYVGSYKVTNQIIDKSDTAVVHFDWTISSNVTQVKGKLYFLACAVDIDEDGNENIHWNSELCSDAYISEGLETHGPELANNSDIITALLLRMDSIIAADATIIDRSLTEAGLAADAKATGDAIRQTNQAIQNMGNDLNYAVNSEASKRATDIAALRSSINGIIALPEGSTTGDAELSGIRTGINGYEYGSAGDAVRDQISAVDTSVSDLAQNIGKPKLIQHEFVNAVNSSGFVTYFDEGEEYQVRGAFIQVMPGQRIRVCASGLYNRFNFSYCNSMSHGSVTDSIDANINDTNVAHYMEKEITVPEGYSLLLVSLYYGNNIDTEYACEIKAYDISSEVPKQLPNISYPEVTGTAAVDGKITSKYVKGFFIRTQPNTKYRVRVIGLHNRFFCYSASELITGKDCTLLYNAYNSTERDFTEYVFDSGDYKYFVGTVAYTGEGFEPNCSVEVYEHYGDPIKIDGIKINNDDIDTVDFYKTSYDVKNVSTTDEVYALYDELKNEYPDFVSRNEIGKNSLGTSIYEYVFTYGDYNTCTTNLREKDTATIRPTILLMAGTHGYERSAVMSTYQFARDLCTGISNLDKVKERVCIKIVPVVTPYSFDSDSRLNENNVNIARNFDVDWKQTNTGSDYSSTAPADQLETQTIQSWIDNNPDALYLIDHHNSAYVSEVSYLAGKADEVNIPYLRRLYFNAIDNLRDYWVSEVGLTDAYTIYAYTNFNGGFGNLATAYNYANKKGIQGLCLETSWNQNTNFGLHSNKTIGIGAEVLGNIILHFSDIAEGTGSVLSTDAKNLLVTILRNGVYNSDQSDNITALEVALSVTEEEEPDTPDEPDEPVTPEVTLSSISAIYSGGDVVVGTAITDLTGIVVTATYSDGSTATVTDYTLSGKIAEGSNTITVSYGGTTTTFTVTGVAESGGETVAMTNEITHSSATLNVGYYSDGGSTKYSDARFPANDSKTILSENVFDEDTDLKITFTPTINTFQCWLFCSTLLDADRRIESGDKDDLFFYVKPSSETFAYGWSTVAHEFIYTVKAGYKFGIISAPASTTNGFTVEVL